MTTALLFLAISLTQESSGIHMSNFVTDLINKLLITEYKSIEDISSKLNCSFYKEENLLSDFLETGDSVSAFKSTSCSLPNISNVEIDVRSSKIERISFNFAEEKHIDILKAQDQLKSNYELVTQSPNLPINKQCFYSIKKDGKIINIGLKSCQNQDLSNSLTVFYSY